MPKAAKEEQSGPDVARFPYLASLNPAQLKGQATGPITSGRQADSLAVTAHPRVPLQILAGPGSGKTRVLTSRVAYLVHEHKLLPSEIVAVTFTNKAASEMKKRLKALLGEREADKLVLGVFSAFQLRLPADEARHFSRYMRAISPALRRDDQPGEQLCHCGCRRLVRLHPLDGAKLNIAVRRSFPA